MREPETGRWLEAGKSFSKPRGVVVAGRPPKPSECTRYVRSRVARELPEIVKELIEKSKTGDAATLKALWQMGQLDKQRVRVAKRKSGLARELLERLGKKEQG